MFLELDFSFFLLGRRNWLVAYFAWQETKVASFWINSHELCEHNPLSVILDGFWTRILLHCGFSNKSSMYLCS